MNQDCTQALAMQRLSVFVSRAGRHILPATRSRVYLRDVLPVLGRFRNAFVVTPRSKRSENVLRPPLEVVRQKRFRNAFGPLLRSAVVVTPRVNRSETVLRTLLTFGVTRVLDKVKCDVSYFLIMAHLVSIWVSTPQSVVVIVLKMMFASKS